MKKITILLVIIFSFLFSTTSWGDWNFVGGYDNGDKVYYDKDRVRKSGKYIYFWELQDFLKPNKYGNLSSTTYVQLDCSIFRYKSLKFHTYTKSMGEGEQTSDYTPPDEWSYPKPNSSGEFRYNKICEENGKKFVQKRQKGVLFYKWIEVNGKYGWYENGDEEKDSKYIGDVENGKPNGYGTVTGRYLTGNKSKYKYEGEWKNGKKHGEGTYYISDRGMEVGEWRNGSIMNGIYYFDGKIFYKYVKGKIVCDDESVSPIC